MDTRFRTSAPAVSGASASSAIARERRYAARNYDPLPVVLARDAALGFAEWVPGEPTVADSLGIAVPAALRMVARPDALLLPCLGFDARGYRLGYGGGFYDRTLAPQPRPATMGIAYACQLESYEIGEYDIPLDEIITEV